MFKACRYLSFKKIHKKELKKMGVEFENFGKIKITFYYTDGCAGEIQKTFGFKDAIQKCQERFSDYCICRAVLWDADTGEIVAILTPEFYMVN